MNGRMSPVARSGVRTGAEPVAGDGHVLALDIGTGSCKGAVFTADGTLVAAARHEYPTHRYPGHRVEQDPADWWRAVCAVCAEIGRERGGLRVAAVGMSGQVPTMAMVDETGRPLGPAVSWQDRRAEEEARWLETHVGAARLAEWLGMDLPIDAAWPPARLLWWSRHEPEQAARAASVLMAKDVVVARLTGVLCSDPWSAKGIVHLLSGEPVAAYFDVLGLRPEIAPPVADPWSVVGVVCAAAARETGLAAGTPVVAGWSDALCGMAGTGALAEPHRPFNLAGTSDIVGCSGQEPAPGVVHVSAAVTSAAAVLYGPTQSGGDSLTWFAEWLARSVEDTVALAATAPPGADGVIFLPYLQGERAPVWDSGARAAFVGLHRQHGAAIGARAVLEGVAMSVRHVLEACGVQPDPARTMWVSGGASRMALWNQIRADVTGLTVQVVAAEDATLLGAAMLGAVGAGIYPDLQQASVMVRPGPRHTPQATAAYDDAYHRYRALYPALKTAGMAHA